MVEVLEAAVAEDLVSTLLEILGVVFKNWIQHIIPGVVSTLLEILVLYAYASMAEYSIYVFQPFLRFWSSWSRKRG